MCGVEAEDWYLTLTGKKEAKERPSEILPTFFESDRCTKCEVPFSSFKKRRHHCRNCGHSFCQEHSDNRVPLPARGFYTAVRVCDDCRLKIWDKWERSKNCHLCDRPFSTVQRRHHCRKCGAPVCNDCSPHRFQAKGWSKKVRMCSACFSTLDQDYSKTLTLTPVKIPKKPNPRGATQIEVSSDEDSEGKRLKPRMTT